MPWQAATCLQRWIAGEPDVKQERHSTDEKYLMEIIEKISQPYAHIFHKGIQEENNMSRYLFTLV